MNILLGNYSEIFAGAELFRYSRLWTRSEYMRCADGIPINKSPFWAKVKEDVGEPNALSEDVVDSDQVVSLMTAILENSGAKLVCDTSKSREYQRIIYDENYFKRFVVHLVRDGRAVAVSQDVSLVDSMKIAAIWCIANLQTKLKYSNDPNYIRISYEDLALDTNETISRIESRLNDYFALELTSVPFDKTQNTYRYAFAGNAMRESFDGSVQYTDKYIQAIGRLNWVLLTLIMSPALFIFGYPFSKNKCRAKFKKNKC